MPEEEFGSSGYLYGSGGGGGGGSGHHGGCETPASEPATDLLDQLLDSEDEDGEAGLTMNAGGGGGGGSRMMMMTGGGLGGGGAGFRRTHQRRLSDPSSTLNDFMRFGIVDRPPSNKP